MKISVTHWKKIITDNKYIPISVNEIVNHDNQKSLTEEQKEQTSLLLENHKELFSGNVGTQKGITVGFKLKENARPYYSKPYGIPVSLREVTKKAISHMCEQGVLREAREDTEWAAPTFAVPQKMVA